MKKTVLPTLAAILLWVGCRSTTEQPSQPSPSPARPQSQALIEIPADSPKLSQIRVADVKSAQMPTDEFTAPGKIEVNPNQVSKVLLPVAGRIAEVLVRFGDAVEKNAPVLTLESPEADAAASACLQADGEITRATAALVQAQADFDRVSDLFRGDAIAKKEVVTAETAVTQAKTTLTQAQTTHQQALARLEMLGLKPGGFRQRITVRAPLAGKITEISVVAGEFRNDLGAPLLTISDLSTVWVSADVPESSIRLVQVREPLEVSLSAYPGEIFRSHVTRIADAVDPQSRTVKVWAELRNPGGRLRPEMFGEVRHVESLHTVAVVPATAVIQAQQRSIVYKEMGKGRFQETDVEVGKRSRDLLPVLKGVRAGDRVVVDGGMLLRGY